MSVLELNGRVFDASTTGTLTLTGEGSATTDVTQGLVKLWTSINMATPAILDSFNASSMTDEATGAARSNFNNNMGNTIYNTTAASIHISGTGWDSSATVGYDTKTTSSISLRTTNGSDALADSVYANTAVHGDLA